MKPKLPRRAAPVFAALATMLAGCDVPMDTLRPQSNFARAIASLYWEIIGWETLILALVVGLIILVLVKHSTRRIGYTRINPTHVNEHLLLEGAWTIGPALILLLIAFPAIVINFRSQPDHPPRHAFHVVVVGHQWWWEFRYPTLGIDTANEAHIPVNQNIYFELHTDDVIHSFWVPKLGGKRDVIPNHTNELILKPDKPGEYFGQCAEFCGLSHANMRMRIFVDTPEQFARWIADETSSPRVPRPAEPHYREIARGMNIFEGSMCTTCHGISGLSTGTIGPNLSHFGSRTTLAGATLPNTEQQLAEWIEHPDKLKPGAKMPALSLSPGQVTAVATYLESLR
ncbi:MAG: cytochrome c oxidase subunit II [Candidatus Binataceae bacterium]